jgi:hypothetical protein
MAAGAWPAVIFDRTRQIVNWIGSSRQIRFRLTEMPGVNQKSFVLF